MASSSLKPTDPLDRDAVLAARAMSPEEKLLAGPRMFDAACADLSTLIKTCFPEASTATVEALIRAIIRIAERRGIL